MPVELGSFDAIIGMDWLVKYQAIIVCAEKLIRIPRGNETLIIHGNGSNRGNEARLHIISYTKTQEYMLKGCPVFLANVTTKETEDKSEKKTRRNTKEHLKAILELLKKEELYAKFSKCEFWLPKVQFIEHVIDSQGIHIDPAKIESIKYWASPKTPTEIHQFLGLAGRTDKADDSNSRGYELVIVRSTLEKVVNHFHEIVRETIEKIIQIKQKMQAARDRQKSYANLKRKPMEIQVEDKVMLKVSPWKGVLELPEELSRVHNTFHVSNLKKCYADEPIVVPLDGLHFDDKLQFIEEPVNREVKMRASLTHFQVQ
ncbi:hypothetical protein Tco_0303485 [Tanacetum coccineum]